MRNGFMTHALAAFTKNAIHFADNPVVKRINKRK